MLHAILPKAEPKNLVTFHDVVLDLQSGELRRGQEIIALRPLATRCLLLLVKRAGVLVTTDELRRGLWGDRVVEWNAGLHQAIRQIRIALKDDDHQIIETVTRQGYRLHAEVEEFREVTKCSPAKNSRLRYSRAFVAGIATPFILLAAFIALCGTLY